MCFVCRKRWKDEMFGINERDDVDCLFFILARFLTDQQKGKRCVHKTKMASITEKKRTLLKSFLLKLY